MNTKRRIECNPIDVRKCDGVSRGAPAKHPAHHISCLKKDIQKFVREKISARNVILLFPPHTKLVPSHHVIS